MKKDNKGFSVPSEIWHSKELDINAKFVACCLIDYFERSGVSAQERLPEYECKIIDEQVVDIFNRNEIDSQKFFEGLIKLSKHSFITKLTIGIDGLVTIKTHF